MSEDGRAEGAVPAGALVVETWRAELFGPAPGRRLWELLDDRLRLALAQGWVMGALGVVDDGVASALAERHSAHAHFDEMLQDLIAHWQSVYDTISKAAGFLDRSFIAGPDMEAMVVTSPDLIGFVSAGEQVRGHTFITRYVDGSWEIAALARRLPVPGWPPAEEEIPHVLGG